MTFCTSSEFLNKEFIFEMWVIILRIRKRFRETFLYTFVDDRMAYSMWQIAQCVSQKHGTNDEQNICKFPRNNRISKIQPFSLSNAQNIPWKWDAEFLNFFQQNRHCFGCATTSRVLEEEFFNIYWHTESASVFRFFRILRLSFWPRAFEYRDPIF